MESILTAQFKSLVALVRRALTYATTYSIRICAATCDLLTVGVSDISFGSREYIFSNCRSGEKTDEWFARIGKLDYDSRLNRLTTLLFTGVTDTAIGY